MTGEQLANQPCVSKSPVCEALNRLEADGLVCIELRRGTFVPESSMQVGRDHFEFREVIELHSIEAATITPKPLAQVSESIDRPM
jgi:DNA-binding GntR family transcriptional regulator